MHVILYCDGRVPQALPEGILEHWKDEVPSLGTGEVIRDFSLLGKQGTKRVFHCKIAKTSQLSRVLTWIMNYNDGKSDPEKIWYWVGKTARDAFESLWEDAEAFAHNIAERVLQYPVEVLEEGQTVTKFVSVYEAINTYSETILPAVLKQYGVPHKFLGDE